MKRHALATTAIVAMLALPAWSQQAQTGASGGGQGGSQAAGQSDQRITQEVARSKGSELYIGPAGVRQIEQALNKAGYDAGPIDGQWDDASKTAMTNFEQAQGLEPTGQVTISAVYALGLSNLLGGQNAGAGGGQNVGNQRRTQEVARSKGAPLYAGPAAVRVVQQSLSSAGYDAGKVDGIWNDATQRAAQNFQQAQGLEPTGVLDVSLIDALGVGNRMFVTGSQGQSSQRLTQETANGGQSQSGNGNGSDQKSGNNTKGGSNGKNGNAGQNTAQASGGGAPIYLGPAGVRRLRQILNKDGYDAGSVNGLWDDDLGSAVQNFQKAQGLEPTGTLTVASLGAIGLQQWLPATFAGGGNSGGGNGGNAGSGGGSGNASAGGNSSGNGSNGSANGNAGAAVNGSAASGGGAAGANGNGANSSGSGNASGANSSSGNGAGNTSQAANGSGSTGNGGSGVGNGQAAGNVPGTVAAGGQSTGGGNGANTSGASGQTASVCQAAGVAVSASAGGAGVGGYGSGNANANANGNANTNGNATATANAGASGNGGNGATSFPVNRINGMEVVGVSGDSVGNVSRVVSANGQNYIVSSRAASWASASARSPCRSAARRCAAARWSSRSIPTTRCSRCRTPTCRSTRR